LSRYPSPTCISILSLHDALPIFPLKNFLYGPITPAAGSTARQEITIQSGISVEKSREIVKKIKDSKIKVQASIQGDFVRVSAKRSEEHTSELQSRSDLVCRLLLE